MKKLFAWIITILTGTVSLTGGLVMILLAQLGVSGYQIHKYKPALSSVVTDRNGQVLMYIHGNEHRLWRDIEEISPNISEATIAMEDKRFYKHPGIDVLSIIRAINANLTTNEIQGGSTITQQYVKNAFLNPKKKIIRKIKEAYLALLIEKINSKEDILEKYLNEVSYGGIYYGVEAASEYYFDKSAADLSVAEAAILAAMTKAPSVISPNGDREKLFKRQKIVINKMYDQGYISQEEKAEALSEEIKFSLTAPEFKARHFSELVKSKLVESVGQAEIETGGFEIQTTLDLNLQAKVEEIVAKQVTANSSYNVRNGAAMVMNPENREVLAWVGSADFYDQSIDGQYDVLRGYRQPGSTLKPFLYALALEKGYTAATVLSDVKTTYEDPFQEKNYVPVNYDSKFHGLVSIRESLANSYNVPATRMLAVLGVENYIDELGEFGLDYIDPKKSGLSLALGGYEIRPMDLANAYATLARQGKYDEMRVIKKWSGNNSSFVDYQTEQVIDNEIAYIVSDILSDNKARTPAFGANSLLNTGDVKVAVKTGTSNQKRDNWAVGYTPKFVVLAWVGNSNNQPMFGVASGLTGATPIWREITDLMVAKTDPEWYERPEKVVAQVVDGKTGGKYCEKGKPKEELFVAGTEPQECIEPPTDSAYKLFEERDGKEVSIASISKEEYEFFMKDPFGFIDKYADVLRADDEPTRVFFKDAIAENFNDPLTKMVGSSDQISL